MQSSTALLDVNAMSPTSDESLNASESKPFPLAKNAKCPKPPIKLSGAKAWRRGAPANSSVKNNPSNRTGNASELNNSTKSSGEVSEPAASHSLIISADISPSCSRRLGPPNVGRVSVHEPSCHRPIDKSCTCGPNTTESISTPNLE